MKKEAFLTLYKREYREAWKLGLFGVALGLEYLVRHDVFTQEQADDIQAEADRIPRMPLAEVKEQQP